MANCKGVTRVGQKWLWRLIVMDRKVPDEEEKKNPTIGSYLYWIIYIQIYVMKKKKIMLELLFMIFLIIYQFL